MTKITKLFSTTRPAISTLGLLLLLPASASAQPNSPGTILTVAGSGSTAYTGDGGPASAAGLQPYGVAVDASGNLFVADYSDSRVRKVTQGIISTFAGCAPVTPVCVLHEPGDLMSATDVVIGVANVAVDTAGNLYITDNVYQRVRKVSPDGTLTNIAGTGQQGSAGGSGAASNAFLNNPSGIFVDRTGNAFFADTSNNRVMRIDTSGNISTVAGNGQQGFTGDGGSPTGAALNGPTAVAVDAGGNIYIADTGNNRIRKVTSAGIFTIAGGADCCILNDGGPATNAFLSGPKGVAVDGAGNVFIADTNSSRIRKIGLNGIITTIAGTGAAGFSGDGGPATAAILNGPTGMTFDTAGDLFFADTTNNRVREIIGAGVSTVPPAISAVVNGASFAPGIAPGSWITIQGTGLAQTTRSWASADFSGNNLPTTIDGVSVMVDSRPAFVYFVSPTQLNVLSPDDGSSGPVRVQVFNALGNSLLIVNLAPAAPALFLFTAKYPAALHTTGVSVGTAGLVAGGNFAPVKPGETIELFGSGFGPTTPATPAGLLVAVPSLLAGRVTATIGGVPALVTYAGETESGLDQINVTVPATLPDGDAAITLSVAGLTTQANLFLTVQH